MAEDHGRTQTFDSDRQYLADVYAKALLGATEKGGNSETVLAEFDSLLADVLDKLPELEATLSSPRVSAADKIGLLDKAFQGKMSEPLLNFLKVVVEHGRFDCLRAIHRSAHHLYNLARGRVEVDLRTAGPIGSELLRTVSRRLQSLFGGPVELTSRVDPDLIGGLVVRVGDTVYDGSVANRLEQLRAGTLDTMARAIRDALDRFAPAESM